MQSACMTQARNVSGRKGYQTFHLQHLAESCYLIALIALWLHPEEHAGYAGIRVSFGARTKQEEVTGLAGVTVSV